MSCADDGAYHVANHGPSVALPGEQVERTTLPLPARVSVAPGSGQMMTMKQSSNSVALLQPKKLHHGTSVIVQAYGPSKPVANKVVLLKHSLIKTSANQTPVQVQPELSRVTNAAVNSKKTVRPAAWLLHTIGLRMAREKVYDDLIDIQEEKELEGQLTTNEQRQLDRLRDAYADLVKQNKQFSVRSKRRCRCGFSTGSRLELELHRDHGSVSGDDYRYSCCLCNLQNIRSPAILAAHIERTHGRQSRALALPPTGFCPYCPYEQRTVTKCKLSRHVINCAVNFRIDRNLAPTAADADIPLFEILHPPSSSVQTATTASETGLKSASSVIADKTSGSSAAVSYTHLTLPTIYSV